MLWFRHDKKQKQLLKGMHHLWNTRETTYCWNQSPCDKCPLCRTDIESWQHVLQCTNEHVVCVRTEYIFEQGLTAMHTDPNLTKWLICEIKSWVSQNEFGEPAVYDITDVDVHEAYEVQHQVGFDSFIQGLVVTELRRVQEQYYKTKNSPVKYNGVRWMKYVMHSMMEFCHDMWAEQCAIVVAGTNEVHQRRIRLNA